MIIRRHNVRYVLYAVLILISAPPSYSAVVDCDALTATQRRQAENIGACSQSAPKALCLPVTDVGLLALLDLLSEEANYQELVPCAESRVVDEFGVLVVADTRDTGCTSSTLGQQIANPQSKRQVAILWLRLEVNQRVRDRTIRNTVESERDRIEEDPTIVVVPEDNR